MTFRESVIPFVNNGARNWSGCNETRRGTHRRCQENVSRLLLIDLVDTKSYASEGERCIPKYRLH